MQQPPLGAGWYGAFGGRYVSETLIPALDELADAVDRIVSQPAFDAELRSLLTHYVGRPTPLTEASRLAAAIDPSGTSLGRLFLKREDLCHTGAHKINNALGQALLAKRLGKKRVIAETGAGQHGVATATACALLGLKCRVYMGVEDMRRQLPNVFRMKLLGTEVVSVQSGTKTLKDAVNDALRDWVTNVEDTHYIIGSALGPHPYPLMVREFQRVIGEEAREQILKLEGRLPHALVACVGGGSNSIGLFHPFMADKDVKFYGVEAGGRGDRLGEHAARFAGGSLGVFQGMLSYVLQNDDGQVTGTHSVSAGLDYASIGPEHAWMKDEKRTEYLRCPDAAALRGVRMLAEAEGIIPALESAHAVGMLHEVVKRTPKDGIIILNVSGRGDKDVAEIARIEGFALNP